MSKMGILGQPGCVLSFMQNILFGSIWVKLGPKDQNRAEQEILLENQNKLRLAQNATAGVNIKFSQTNLEIFSSNSLVTMFSHNSLHSVQFSQFRQSVRSTATSLRGTSRWFSQRSSDSFINKSLSLIISVRQFAAHF